MNHSMHPFLKRKFFWIKDFFNGGLMWKDFKEVDYIIHHPVESESIRRKKLSDILLFAKNNTNFYSEIKGTELSDFPIINKLTILNNYEDFLVAPEKIPGQKGDMHIQRTSGSTGTPFEIPQDTLCRIRRIATIKVANELIGFKSFVPLMHFRSFKYGSFPHDITIKRDLNIIYADNSRLTPEFIERVFSTINTYGVKFIRGYMTSFDLLSEYAVEHGMELVNRLTFISSGELLLDSVRDRIVNRMGCNIISQYANEESGLFGQNELNGSGAYIKFYLANCFIEVLKMDSDEPVADDEMGRIVVTDYTNRAMPLIRYETGDIAMVDERSQSGEVLSIKNLSGRKADMIFKTDGTPVSLFNSIPIEIIFNTRIRQWQFVQKGEKDYLLKLSTLDDSLRDNAHLFVSLLQDILGADAEITVEFLHELPITNSGKRKVIVQEYYPRC